jgi:hypothetical protein
MTSQGAKKKNHGKEKKNNEKKEVQKLTATTPSH